MSEEFMYGLFFLAGVVTFYALSCWDAKRDAERERDAFDDGGER